MAAAAQPVVAADACANARGGAEAVDTVAARISSMEVGHNLGLGVWHNFCQSTTFDSALILCA
jgi:hypothetical protein